MRTVIETDRKMGIGILNYQGIHGLRRKGEMGLLEYESETPKSIWKIWKLWEDIVEILNGFWNIMRQEVVDDSFSFVFINTRVVT